MTNTNNNSESLNDYQKEFESNLYNSFFEGLVKGLNKYKDASDKINERKSAMKSNISKSINNVMPTKDPTQFKNDQDLLHLSAPWIEFERKIEALFTKDTDISFVYDADNNPYVLDIYINGINKYVAATQLIGESHNFGNVTLEIHYHLGNENEPEKMYRDLFADLFEGNPVLKSIATTPSDMAFGGTTYLCFAKEVVQYWNDDLSNPHGVTSTLYETIAGDVFKDTHEVRFTTETDLDQ